MEEGTTLLTLSRRHIQIYFLEWKVLNFKYNSIKMCSLGSNWEYVSISSDNGLAPNRHQAITWTNADSFLTNRGTPLPWQLLVKTCRLEQHGHHSAGHFFKYIFFNENCCNLIQISPKLLTVQLTIIHNWFRQWLGVKQAPSHYLKQC